MPAAAAPAAASPPPANRLLTGPILPTLLRLAVPNVLSMTMAVLVGIAETWYIGLPMLTGMMSAGAMGGGVSSAISRALGAGDLARANTLAQHAAVIGAGAGAVYTVLIIAAGPWLYHLLGGRATVLAQAIDYANVLFCGAILVWLSNCLASILRGSGNMRVPSVVILATSALQIVLGGLLGLGAGPVPRLGMIGVAWGHILATATAVAFLYWYLATGQGRLRLVLRDLRLQWPMFADILKVGALACLSPVQSVLAVLVFTGLVARLGVLPLAGYGIGQRLEFLLIPIAFGIGVAAVPMVGMAIGAGQVARARKVAWTAGLVSAFNLAIVGAVVSVAPDLWAGLFTQDAGVLETARQYLRWAGPAFPFFGLGLTLYFASQGSGKVLGPVLASTLRLVLVGGAGAWLVAHEAQAWQYFALVATAMVIYGLSTALSIRLTSWQRAR
ncbi:MAG: MATE family efflux transporter [Burkholderiales bacterium]|nr:MATE family efflux transporter [Burkholderiales bacterium]